MADILHDAATPARPSATSFAKLALLWGLATALNLGKPLHIDDTYYVAQARWIAEHPTRPSSGLVFWESTRPEPFHRAGNHPYLVPALMALVVRLEGGSEIALHALTAVFAALAIALFHALARRHLPSHASGATALFTLSPGFVAEQNVMLDVPLVASWLGFFLALGHRGARRRVVAAGAIAAVALWIKLLSVFLLLVLAVEGVGAMRAREASAQSLALAIALPLIALAGYVLAGWLEHGEIVVVSRALARASFTATSVVASAGPAPARFVLGFVVLGGIAPWLACFVRLRPQHLVVVAALTFALFALARLVYLGLPPDERLERLVREPPVHTFLRAAFFVVGSGITAFVLLRMRAGDEGERSLARWFVGGLCAIAVLTPFAAARHGLLVLAPAILLVLRARASPRRLAGAVMFAVVLGVATAVADHRFASAHAEQAPRMRDAARALAGPEAHLYFVGHWGWQHYAERVGFEPYVAGETRLASGDLLLEPLDVHAQPIAAEDEARLEIAMALTVEAGPLDWVRTVVDAEGLYCTWHGLPWTFRTEPLARFRLRRMVSSANPATHPRRSP